MIFKLLKQNKTSFCMVITPYIYVVYNLNLVCNLTGLIFSDNLFESVNSFNIYCDNTQSRLRII